MTATMTALHAAYHVHAAAFELAADAETRARDIWHDALAATFVPAGGDEIEYFAACAALDAATVAYDTYHRLAGARDHCFANLSASRDALTRALKTRSLPATPTELRPVNTMPLPEPT